MEKGGAEFGEAELCAFMDHFWSIDRDGEGFIHLDNMRAFAIREDYQMSEEQLLDLIDDKDANQDGRVSVREFVAATHRPMPFHQPWLYQYLYTNLVEDEAEGMSLSTFKVLLETLEMAFTDDDIEAWTEGRKVPLSMKDVVSIFLPDK